MARTRGGEGGPKGESSRFTRKVLRLGLLLRGFVSLSMTGEQLGH